MRDPFTWSLPLGRIFGITVKVHLLFIIFILVMWLRPALDTKGEFPPGAAVAMLALMGLIFFSVLLHEFGHCFAARMVDGDAEEVLLWPLGGLAFCDVPHTPRANFVTAAGGPAVNLMLCILAAGVLLSCSLVPPLNPLPDNAWCTKMWNFQEGVWYGSQFAGPFTEKNQMFAVNANLPIWNWKYFVAQFFWVNWALLLLNVILVGFPLDGGRMLQATLWPRFGYRRSMLTVIFSGFLVMFIVGICGLWLNEVLWLCLAAFVYFACRNEWVRLETGQEDTLFGYDFSQGYTSLEKDDEDNKRRVKRPNFFQRWLQQRAQRKLEQEMEQRAYEETRMDELLAKIQRDGKASLTDEENRFLKRVSDRYRNKK